MEYRPIVSIIIPCFNAEQYIESTIASVLNQSFQNFEIIIVNDGSTDNTETKIKAIINRKITYINKQNTGVSDSRNLGIKLSKGKYIALLDADDIFLPNNLEKKLHYLEKGEYPVVFSDVKIKDFTSGVESYAKGNPNNVKKRLLEFIGDTLPVPPSNLVIRKDLTERINGFDVRLSTSADWDFAVRLAHLTLFGYIPEPLVIYRQHPNQMHKNIPLMEKDMLYAFRKTRTNGLFESERHYRYCYAKLALTLSGSYINHNRDYLKALKYFMLSMMFQPIHIRKKLLG